MLNSLDISVIGFAILATILLRLFKPKRLQNLPPGPPNDFFRDNRRDISQAQPWKTFTAWNNKYGPVVSFYLGRTPVIVLGTAQVAWDLLEKRGEIYSGRPRNIIGHEILSGGMRGVGMSSGTRWRNWRSLMQAGMSSTASVAHQRFQSLESKILLRDLVTEKDSEQFSQHLKRFAMSVVFCLSYGQRVKSLQDDVVIANLKTDGYFRKAHIPGKYLVESWPILLALPRPLQWFRWEPERNRALDTELYMSLMNDVKKRMLRGTARPCVATRALEKQKQFGLNDLETAYALSAPWAAGIGTTTSTHEVFILAMILHPSVMKKAQDELDSVVGDARLPSFEDASSLPYIQSLIKEVTRWRPIVPGGLAHAVTADDSYDGMFIPNGSTIFPNIHAMTQDPKLFPEPDDFRPERYLGNNDSRLANFNLPFGFGRRICPGIYIAQQSVFINVVRLLWAFDIVPPVSNGVPILPSRDAFIPEIVTRPVPFKYLLVPRRSNVVDLIMEEAERAEDELAAWNV